MKTLLLFTVLLAPALLAVSIDSGEAKVRDVRMVPHLKQTYHRVDWDESNSLRNIQYMIQKPGQLSVPSGNDHHRFIRRADTCKLPKNVTTSKLDCKVFSRMIRCNQTCIFGHTFKEGIQRVVKCDYSVNAWSPTFESEECKPFVDCTLSLAPGGEYKCYSNFMQKGPRCEVSCSHYEDKPPVPKSTYSCDLKGKWEPELPHCATAGTGLELEPVPMGPKTIA